MQVLVQSHGGFSLKDTITEHPTRHFIIANQLSELKLSIFKAGRSKPTPVLIQLFPN